MARRRVLRDDTLQARFDERGYVVVPLLSADQVDELYRWYDERAGADGPNPPGAYDDTYAEFSTIHSYPEFRAAAYHAITTRAAPEADRYLVDYLPLVANFVNKPPGTGVVPAHQNWSVVDESRFQSVSVWIALVDCVQENGALQVLDGSHRAFRGRRGMWSYASFGDVEQLLVDEYLTPVHVRAGEAMILDDSLVHYSPPNVTDARRLAIQLVMRPADAEPIFFQEVGRHDDVLDVDVWRVDEPFFWNFWHGDGDERHGERLERIEVPLAPIAADDIRTRFRPRASVTG
jgi:hypothetical protein